MIYVPDTNLILRSIQTISLQHTVAKNALAEIVRKNGTLCLLPQTLYELWNVCTRPEKNNGLGKSHDETEELIHDLESTFSLLHDSQAVYQEGRHLVRLHSVSGVQVHDARIAAAIRVHGVSCLVTFNGDDFKRFGITAVHPANV